MLYPLLPTIRAAAARVAPALLSEGALGRIAEAVRAIPDAMSGCFFECPLSAQGARVDILVATRATSEGRVELAREGAWPDRSSLWNGGLRDFYRRWADPADSLHRRIPLALLEFDLDDAFEGRPPGLHVCVDPAFLEHGWEAPADAPALGAAELAELASDVLGVVTGAPPDPGVLRRLERCRAALPPGGRLLHVSIMLSRPERPLKLNAVVPVDALPGWLDAIGWPGDPRVPARTLARHGFGMRAAKVDIALGAELGARLGLEICFPGEPETDPRWRGLLERLVADGLCSAAEARALAAWPGRDEVPIEGLRWPALLERSLEIKLVSEGDRQEAKAYLGFVPRFSLFGSAPAIGEIERDAALPRRALRPILPLPRVLEGPEIARTSALLGSDARRRLAEAARLLPDACSSWCLECRLAPGSDQVDVLGCIRVCDGGRLALAGLDQPGWEPIASFVERWRDPRSALHDAVPFIWLELDLTDTAPLVPSLYVGVEARPQGAESSALEGDPPWTDDRLRHILDEAVGALGIAGLEASCEGARRCFGALPDGARLNCLGLMIPRRTSAVRLSLELPSTALRSYLRDIGWPGPPALLDPIEPFLARGVDRLALAVDVADTVAARLGVELFFHHPPAIEPRFAALLDALVEHGWCDREKRRGLDEWRGIAPFDLTRGVERTVYHVKVIVERGAPPIVKSYPWLTAVFTPMTR